jgi:acyl dehydratase
MILTPTQNDLDLFARLSGDANPIHVSPEFAASSGFGLTVAHGAMLTAWLLAASGRSDIPSATSAMFPAPAFAGEALCVVGQGSDWHLQRVADQTIVCQLSLDQDFDVPVAPHAHLSPSRPLRVGMTATSTHDLTAEDLRAMQTLQAEAGAHGPDLAGVAVQLGMISSLLGMALPGQGTNYLKQETRWLNPIAPGGCVQTQVTITRLRPEKNLVDLLTLTTDDTGTILAQGRALVSARDVVNAFVEG